MNKVNDKFQYKNADAGQIADIGSIKEKASELLDLIENNCNKSRESSLAITKLEECVMWACKDITHN